MLSFLKNALQKNNPELYNNMYGDGVTKEKNFAADIRMGYVRAGTLNWLTPVHTAANVFVPFADELKFSPNRHLLTRFLKLHRRFEPEYFDPCEHISSNNS